MDPHLEKPLLGKVAVVTGASRGIGRALALGFVDAGAQVCCAARSADALGALVRAVEDRGGSALAVPTDVRDERDVKAMLDRAAAQFGGLDIVLVNAGGNFDRNSVETGVSDAWKATVELNLFGAYYCIKHAVPHLRARGAGKIITVGSGLGHHPIPNDSAYACSKAALWMLTRSAAQELASERISVNELIPGPVQTEMATEAFRKTVVEARREWLKNPEDVVALALFLAVQPDWGPSAQSFSLMRRVS